MHNMKFAISTIFEMEFSCIKYIHNIVRPWPPTKTFLPSQAELNSDSPFLPAPHL